MTKHHRDLEEAERSGNNEKLDQILTACLNVKEGEKVWIHGWDHTIDLASEIALLASKKELNHSLPSGQKIVGYVRCGKSRKTCLRHFQPLKLLR